MGKSRSQNWRVVQVRRDLWGCSAPTSLLRAMDPMRAGCWGCFPEGFSVSPTTDSTASLGSLFSILPPSPWKAVFLLLFLSFLCSFFPRVAFPRPVECCRLNYSVESRVLQLRAQFSSPTERRCAAINTFNLHVYWGLCWQSCWDKCGRWHKCGMSFTLLRRECRVLGPCRTGQQEEILSNLTFNHPLRLFGEKKKTPELC